jgi:hypothetical protein
LFRQRNSLDGGKQTLRVLNELLIVRMLAEILHTVRISSRSDVLVAEPFLVVGLIASIRRILSTGHPCQSGGRDERQRDCFPQFDDGTWFAESPRSGPGVFDYALAVLPDLPGERRITPDRARR